MSLPNHRLNPHFRARLPKWDPDTGPIIVGTVAAVVISGAIYIYWDSISSSLSRSTKPKSNTSSDEPTNPTTTTSPDHHFPSLFQNTKTPVPDLPPPPPIQVDLSDPARGLPLDGDVIVDIVTKIVSHTTPRVPPPDRTRSTDALHLQGATDAVRKVAGSVAGKVAGILGDGAAAKGSAGTGAAAGMDGVANADGKTVVMPTFEAQRSRLIDTISGAKRANVPLLEQEWNGGGEWRRGMEKKGGEKGELVREEAGVGKRRLVVGKVKGKGGGRFSAFWVKGSPGIGKRTALQHYAFTQSHHRPAIFIDLSELYPSRQPHDRHMLDIEFGDTEPSDDPAESQDDQEDQEEQNIWIKALETAFGVGSSSEDSRSHLTHSLRLIAQSSTHGPTLLILTDVHLLFTGSQRIFREKTTETLRWLHERCVEGSLEVVLAEGRGGGSGVLKTVHPYTLSLATCRLTAAPAEEMKAYLLGQVNSVLPQHKEFSETQTTTWCQYFGGDLREVRAFVEGEGDLAGENGCTSLFRTG
ncbi:hypothetical protein HDV00_008226 [Rhizophlyctis rosea]|nr:hypothetical protein HDV00_008226 [Rhizophlyctis rosea]